MQKQQRPSRRQQEERGTLIPTTSVEQYAATLATWFGVSAANLPTVVPYIGNFPSANLGFLG